MTVTPSKRKNVMRKVWPETFVEDNNLAFNISVLRKLFGESGASPQYIKTVPKRGYRFIASVAEVPNGRPAPLDAAPAAPISAPAPGWHSRW
jgi:DNA-binding winged helix-turn-helix (wHTH) protein